MEKTLSKNCTCEPPHCPVVHAGHDDGHLGPEDRERNTARGALSPAIPALQYQCSCPSGQTGRLQNILGLATPVKGFPKGNCPLSERKPRSSAQKRLDRPKKLPHPPPKGALTTTRPLLVYARPTGETCAKNFADTCYTASGPRARFKP